MKSRFNWYTYLNNLYFAVLILQLLDEIFSFGKISIVSMVLSPIVLGLLYFATTIKHSVLFYMFIGLHLLSNLFFSFGESVLFVYGIFAFMALRVIAIVIILKLTMAKNYLHIVATSFPFLVIFFYLISVTDEISNYEFNTLIVQSVLISFLGGLAVTNYLKVDNRQHSWLLISTLLFIGLRFLVFIDRYVNEGLVFSFNRPIGLILSSFAFYAFYKYVVAGEREQLNAQ